MAEAGIDQTPPSFVNEKVNLHEQLGKQRAGVRRLYLTAYWWISLALLAVLGACQGSGSPAPPTRGSRTPAAEPSAVGSAQATRRPGAGQPSATPANQPTPSPGITLTAADLNGVEVQLWHPWSGAAGEAFEALVADFNAENPYGVRLEARAHGTYNELYDQVRLAIPAGETPDLAVGYLYEILAWREAGAPLVNLDRYVEDPSWGLSQAEQDDFLPVFWEHDMVNQARLGFPAQRFAQLLYYNQSWAEELGFDTPPETPREFMTQACAAAQANRADDDSENNGAGGWIANAAPEVMLGWLYAFDSPVVNRSGSGYDLDTPESEAALTFLQDLYASGCAWQVAGEVFSTDIVGGDTASGGHLIQEYTQSAFASRLALLAAGSVAGIADQEEALAFAGNDDQWTVLPFPSPEGDPAIAAYGPSFSLFASAPENQLAAWTFLKWFTSEEIQSRWIAATGSYPLQAGVLARSKASSSVPQQWSQALDFLPYARSEPPFESWGVVRWALSDLGTQAFRSYFGADRIPAALELLDDTAAELHRR